MEMGKGEGEKVPIHYYQSGLGIVYLFYYNILQPEAGSNLHLKFYLPQKLFVMIEARSLQVQQKNAYTTIIITKNKTPIMQLQRITVISK